jgi:two-component system phosphate regulon sensor histidine kinase PhoR
MNSLPLLFERALLIEDDTSHAMLIARALRESIGHVDIARSSAEGLKALESNRYDLVISDLKLPDSPEGAHVEAFVARAPAAPLLVLTSSHLLSDAVLAMKRGARDFIVKDFGASFKEVLLLSLDRLKRGWEEEQERRRLTAEMKALRGAIEYSTDGLAVFSPQGDLAYSNGAFADILKQWGSNGHRFDECFAATPLIAAHVSEQIAQKRRELPMQGVWTTEILMRGAQERAYSLTLTVVSRDPSSAYESVVWIRDISVVKQRERLQRELLSTTTHDLKGPLGAILISSELLQEMLTGHDKAAGLALRIGSAAQGTINLIEEFLSARRIQEGSFILRPVDVEIAALCREIVDEFKPIVQSRRMTLTLEGGPMNACIDVLAFRRAISNLVSNAVKFTQQGGAVSIAVATQGERCTIAVSDTGCGLSPSEVSLLFEKFSRLDKHQEVSGSGLGLFFVKSIVTAHGGTIGVTSSLGRGTTFQIEIPLKPPVNAKGQLFVAHF